MSWKDILVFVADIGEDEAALALGEELAARFDAHIAAASLTALPDEPLAYEPTVVAGVWAELLGRARAQAESAHAALQARLARAARPVELRRAEALARDLGRVAAVHARYADIAVLTRPGDDEGGELRAEIIEGVLFHAGRPALVAPPAWRAGASFAKRIVIAWDASREATRALADAGPLIDGADEVAIVTVDARPKPFGHGELPGVNIAAHLERRGVDVSVRNIDGQGRSISQALCDEVRALNADLVVMGGYASSRLRELVFGGATRDLLRISEAPILMAH